MKNEYIGVIILLILVIAGVVILLIKRNLPLDLLALELETVKYALVLLVPQDLQDLKGKKEIKEIKGKKEIQQIQDFQTGEPKYLTQSL